MQSSPDRSAWNAPSVACTNHPTVPVGTACSRCRRPYCPDCLVPLRGEWLCDHCKHATLRSYFRVYTLPPGTAPGSSILGGPGAVAAPPAPGLSAPASPQPDAPGQPAASGVFEGVAAGTTDVVSPATDPAGGAVRCSLHANSVAEEACERCGDFMCPLCSTCYEGRFYCLRCFDLLWQRGELRGGAGAASSRPGSDAAIALVLALVAWPAMLCNLFNLLPGGIALFLGIGYLRKNAGERAASSRGVAIAAIAIAGLAMAVSVFNFVRALF